MNENLFYLRYISGYIKFSKVFLDLTIVIISALRISKCVLICIDGLQVYTSNSVINTLVKLMALSDSWSVQQMLQNSLVTSFFIHIL